MVFIIKASGDVVPYDVQKLRNSLFRIRVDEKLIQQVIQQVSHLLVENMTMHQIYRIVIKILRNASQYLAANYDLKKAMMQLGTSGYLFEKDIGELIKRRGFSVQNNRYLPSRCVNHEVDVVAKKKGKFVVVQSKYHNRPNLKCDVKVALYVRARVDDIELKISESQSVRIEWCLVTNTRFTADPLQYGVCAGLHMVSWDHPYIVFCKSIINNLVLLEALRIPDLRKKSIIQQCKELTVESS